MILVDTSVWIDHLRSEDHHLITRLAEDRVMTHPMVVGELACGNLSNRGAILTMFSNLPRASIATDDQVLRFIERNQLMGKGINYIDFHLLAATELTEAAELWTRDKDLMDVASKLNLAYEI